MTWSQDLHGVFHHHGQDHPARYPTKLQSWARTVTAAGEYSRSRDRGIFRARLHICTPHHRQGSTRCHHRHPAPFLHWRGRRTAGSSCGESRQFGPNHTPSVQQVHVQAACRSFQAVMPASLTPAGLGRDSRFSYSGSADAAAVPSDISPPYGRPEGTSDCRVGSDAQRFT